MAETEPGEELVLGPTDGQRSARMLGWALGGIVGAGAGYTLVALLDEPRPLFAALAGAVTLACVVGFVAALRHLVWVDSAGIHVRTLVTTDVPWTTVQAVRLDRKVIRTPPMQRGYGMATEDVEGEVIVSRLVLVAELRNGRRLSLPVRVQEDSMTAKKAAELARLLDQLRQHATIPPPDPAAG